MKKLFIVLAVSASTSLFTSCCKDPEVVPVIDCSTPPTNGPHSYYSKGIKDGCPVYFYY
ncbi:MAG: hypothetical protein JWL92_141 [Candidatus Nomurabacteria bacterium]|nr:hypothetical protein [Candidatus Nomurabacteria bacterium]